MSLNNSQDMRDFLKKLDAADFSVSAWECEFIESNLTREHFSPKQREIILKMEERYGKRIGWT